MTTMVGKLSKDGLMVYLERDKIEISHNIACVFRDAKTSFGSDIIELRKFHIDCLSQAECYTQGLRDSDKHFIFFYFSDKEDKWILDSNVPDLDTSKYIALLQKNCKIPKKPMSLDEAIEHCKQKAKEANDDCAKEHAQLAEWLTELKARRENVSLKATL